MIKKENLTTVETDLYTIQISDSSFIPSIQSYVAASKEPIRYLKAPFSSGQQKEMAKITDVLIGSPQIADKSGGEYIVGLDVSNPKTDCWFIICVYYRYGGTAKSIIIASNGIDDYLCRSISDCKLVFTEGLKDCIRRAITLFVNSFVKN